IKMPLWVRPVVGGLLIGTIALAYPEVLGVGYEATNQALYGHLSLTMLLALLLAKTLATAITLASRFGGGVFSPALYLGAMVGGAFGIIAAGISPDLASSGGVYAMLGMGAVAAS
ncbi:MAG: chloride channel protein, partial [Pseudomonadota bacterium]